MCFSNFGKGDGKTRKRNLWERKDVYEKKGKWAADWLEAFLSECTGAGHSDGASESDQCRCDGSRCCDAWEGWGACAFWCFSGRAGTVYYDTVFIWADFRGDRFDCSVLGEEGYLHNWEDIRTWNAFSRNCDSCIFCGSPVYSPYIDEDLYFRSRGDRTRSGLSSDCQLVLYFYGDYADLSLYYEKCRAGCCGDSCILMLSDL